MHILIDIGNSTVVIAMTDNKGDITATWRFKTKKEETASFFRYELRQGLRKYNVEAADIEKITISSVVPEVNDDIAQPMLLEPHAAMAYQPSSSTLAQLPHWELSMKTEFLRAE